jgi:Domain of unknown function (DUF4397)
MRRAQYVLFVALGALMALAFSPLTARAGQPGMAWLRQLYLSSDSPNVDLYIDGTRAWSNVPYRTISKYKDLTPGTHMYQVRPAGAAPDSPPSGQVQATLNADSYYSVVVAGKFQSMNLNVYPDSPGPNPPPDRAVARFLHATPDVPKVDLFQNGSTALYRNISFMEASPYLQMPAGHYDIELRVAGTNKAIFTLKDFNADGGHIHTLAAAGGIGRPVELVQMYDSTSVAVTPQGGAATGGGGMAGRRPAMEPLRLGVLAAGAAALLLLARRRRTPVS